MLIDAAFGICKREKMVVSSSFALFDGDIKDSSGVVACSTQILSTPACYTTPNAPYTIQGFTVPRTTIGSKS